MRDGTKMISKIDYCNALYMGLPLRLTWRLQWVQNVAARLVPGVNKFDHLSPVLVCLHWFSVEFWAKFKMLMVVYIALNILRPCYFSNCLFLRQSAYSTHSSQASLHWLPYQGRQRRQSHKIMLSHSWPLLFAKGS